MNDTNRTILIVLVAFVLEGLVIVAGYAVGRHAGHVWNMSRPRLRLGRFARARSPLAPRRSLPATDLACELRVDERAAYLHLGRREQVGGVASTVDTLLGSHGILVDFDAAGRLRGIEFLDLDRVPTGTAPRPRSGLGGLGDALRAVADGVSQVSWPPEERFAADLDTETGSDVLVEPWMCGHYDEIYGSCRLVSDHPGPHLHGRPLDTEDAH